MFTSLILLEPVNSKKKLVTTPPPFTSLLSPTKGTIYPVKLHAVIHILLLPVAHKMMWEWCYFSCPVSAIKSKVYYYIAANNLKIWCMGVGMVNPTKIAYSIFWGIGIFSGSHAPNFWTVFSEDCNEGIFRGPDNLHEASNMNKKQGEVAKRPSPSASPLPAKLVPLAS